MADMTLCQNMLLYIAKYCKKLQSRMNPASDSMTIGSSAFPTQARVVIVGEDDEGALPSVVGGLVAAPVIAVPTSVGYGASLGGIAALLGMLNSCAPNVAVVNIDNGFGAAYVAAMMVRSVTVSAEKDALHFSTEPSF
jgi:phosphoribosylcarboxyaminoimidazole (NCAIR) mutase